MINLIADYEFPNSVTTGYNAFIVDTNNEWQAIGAVIRRLQDSRFKPYAIHRVYGAYTLNELIEIATIPKKEVTVKIVWTDPVIALEQIRQVIQSERR